MYILEILVKIFKTLKKQERLSFNINENPSEDTSHEDCPNHIYLPIDSTKKYLACKNCGHLIKNDKV